MNPACPECSSSRLYVSPPGFFQFIYVSIAERFRWRRLRKPMVEWKIACLDCGLVRTFIGGDSFEWVKREWKPLDLRAPGRETGPKDW